MKRLLLIASAASAVLISASATKADVIADWTFQSAASTNNIIGTGKTLGQTQGGILADIGTGTANSFHSTTATAWSIPAGNGSTNSWSANNWSIGDYYQFSVSTIGFQNITVSFDQTGSATGPRDFNFEYSLDGTTFTTNSGTFYQLASPAVGWNVNTPVSTTSFSIDLSAVTALNNVSPIYLRIADNDTVAINGTTVGTGGTDRIDNFVVNGISTVPEPSSIALLCVAGGAGLLALRRKR